jgi:hypothetical protein
MLPEQWFLRGIALERQGASLKAESHAVRDLHPSDALL